MLSVHWSRPENTRKHKKMLRYNVTVEFEKDVVEQYIMKQYMYMYDSHVSM